MGENTKIQWTDFTFNPWIGCTKVHAGCTNCYAEAQNGRWSYNGGTWGKGAPRKVTADANWKKPVRWARAAAKAGRRDKVFCASLADVLDEEAPPGAQARLWGLIRQTAVASADGRVRLLEPADLQRFGGLDWQLLTKRPEHWDLIPEDVRPLVWLGTSISDQKTANEWIPRLAEAQGFKHRFLSIEPMVGPIDLRRLLQQTVCTKCCNCSPGVMAVCDRCGYYANVYRLVDWVIVGGESGPGARPFDWKWAEAIVEQCSAAGVACFVKQLGSRPVGPQLYATIADRKGGDPSEWPPSIRVRQFPAAQSLEEK